MCKLYSVAFSGNHSLFAIPVPVLGSPLGFQFPKALPLAHKSFGRSGRCAFLIHLQDGAIISEKGQPVDVSHSHLLYFVSKSGRGDNRLGPMTLARRAGSLATEILSDGFDGRRQCP